MNDHLASAAYDLCISIRDDAAFSKEIGRTANGQAAACPEVIAALQRKCPGLTTQEYQAAIARAMQASR